MKAPDTYWTGKDPLGTHKKPFAEEVDEYYEHLHKKRKHCKHKSYMDMKKMEMHHAT